MLRGRCGAWGHIRWLGDGRRVLVKGLPPEAACALYAIWEGRARECGRQTADRDGQARFTAALAGRLYVTAEGRVIAWEGGEDAEETYCLACALEERRSGPAAPRETEERTAAPAAAPAPAPPAPPASERDTGSLPEPEAAGYTLRPPGNGEPVDALPALIWPPMARPLRPYFLRGMPFAPFSAPGWRFVRMPARVPGAAFCAVGFQVRDGRVDRIAYAVPGPPQRPPVPLPGYRYRPGRQGEGYWVAEKSLDFPRNQ